MRTQAVVVSRFGGPEVLELDDLLLTAPGYDEILVHVHAASVNPVDIKIREGQYPRVPASRLPVVLGRDLCGVVVACGMNVSDVKVDDRVIAFIGEEHGAYAEHAIVKAGEYALKPQSIDDVTAAAIPLAGITAWQGLFDHGQLAANQTVLIHGGAGGVGHLAVQLAKAAGARVVTTVSAKDLDFARSLGADRVIDYHAQAFEQQVRDVDLVLDLVGGETQERSWSVLKATGGRLVSTLSEPSAERTAVHGATALRYTAQPNADQLARIAALVDAGRVRVQVDRVFSLDRAGAAQTHLQTGHVQGKVVLKLV